MATLDGNPVFGPVSEVTHMPAENVQQMNAFMGVNGVQTIYGGSRGDTFNITGMFVADDLAGIAAAEADLLSFADGQIHTFVDNLGRSWQNIVFKKQYSHDPKVGVFMGQRCMKFRCILIAVA